MYTNNGNQPQPATSAQFNHFMYSQIKNTFGCLCCHCAQGLHNYINIMCLAGTCDINYVYLDISILILSLLLVLVFFGKMILSWNIEKPCYSYPCTHNQNCNYFIDQLHAGVLTFQHLSSSCLYQHWMRCLHAAVSQFLLEYSSQHTQVSQNWDEGLSKFLKPGLHEPHITRILQKKTPRH